jgi:hypothetical protein
VEIFGRASQQARIIGLLDDLPEHGGSLVLCGAAGAGKSTLLDWAATEAGGRGFRVLSVAGVQAEFGLPYAGLHGLTVQLGPESSGKAELGRVLTSAD